MNKPVLESKINGYIFHWDKEALLAQVSHCRVHSRDGRTTGELTISTNSDKPLILLPATQFNFSSDQTSSRQAKALAEKYPQHGVDWIELFDYLRHRVQELARAGEESEEVWAQDEITKPELLLEPLIIRGMPNVIFGEKGVNKSTIAYLCGAIVLISWGDNPLGLVPYDKGIKTLVLDWETDRETFDYYLARIKRGTQAPAFSLNYRHCVLPLAEDLESIERLIERDNIELLIIDSLAAAAGGEDSELKGSQSALSFNTALRKLKTTSLIIAQTSKQQEQHGKRKTIYGSTLFTYYSRNVLELCHSEDIDTNTKHLALFHRECNLFRKWSPIGIRMDFHDDGGIAIEREPVSMSEFSEKINTQARVMEVLKQGALEVKDIALALDVSESNARVALSRLNKRGKVVKMGKAYGLAADSQPF